MQKDGTTVYENINKSGGNKFQIKKRATVYENINKLGGNKFQIKKKAHSFNK